MIHNFNASIICWLVVIPMLFLSSVPLSAQSKGAHHLSVNAKFSKTILGESLLGTGSEPREITNYYTPGGYGLGAEFAYEYRKGNTSLAINLGFTNLKYITDIAIDYDVTFKPNGSLNMLFAELQAVGKYYFPLGKFEMSMEFGLGGSRYSDHFNKQAFFPPDPWGIQVILGNYFIFPVSDNFSLVFGGRLNHQLNKPYKFDNSFAQVLGVKDIDGNDNVLHFTFGSKIRLGAKKRKINTGRFPMDEQ